MSTWLIHQVNEAGDDLLPAYTWCPERTVDLPEKPTDREIAAAIDAYGLWEPGYVILGDSGTDFWIGQDTGLRPAVHVRIDH